MLFDKKPSEMREKFRKLRDKEMKGSIKILLMQGLMQELRIMCESLPKSQLSCVDGSQKLLQVSQTNCSQFSAIKSNILPFQSSQQVQCSIIEKQKYKVELYNQIEQHQDDLFQLQKCIQTKKDYDEALDKKIFQLQHIIEKQSKIQTSQQSAKDKKPISARIKQFFL